ncbi:hypothetical protein [Erythrobacter sp.]|uniref:hypothetical protein n=1 Tax=Erythrobacter sp. TaxID=1042 RepID=UPI0025D34759|nr:hypothetical protein [Erythrobacter sp.]
MSVPERPDQVWVALLWSAIFGALIGGVSLTAWIILDGSAQGIYEMPWLALIFPLAIAGLSLFVVIPCTLIFGIPSALLIRRFALSPLRALTLCLSFAIATQVACIWMVLWHDYSKAGDYLFTTTFALGAAVVLWWRLTRVPSYPADRPR